MVPTIDFKNLQKPSEISTHFENLVKPTMSTTEKGWDRFVSFSGRGICLVRTVEYALNLPFRLAQTICWIALSIIKIFCHLLLLPFDYTANKEGLYKYTRCFFNQTIGLAITPLSVVMDTTKLAMGVVIHPGAAIHAPE